MSNWIWSAAALSRPAIALAIALSACGGRDDTAGAPGAGSADTEWVEIEGLEFPAGMEEADPEILEAYVFAAKHPEVLRYMPCYCGCENPRFAHQNNYDCFVDGIDHSRDVPRVSPDAMGFS